MLYYFKKGKNATETPKKICAVYGEGAVTDWTCQKCSAKFCAGDFSLGNAPWSGRTVEVDSNQIEALIENNQHSTMQETADILKISKSIVTFENEKCVFYFMEKTTQTFWPTQYFVYYLLKLLPEKQETIK